MEYKDKGIGMTEFQIKKFFMGLFACLMLVITFLCVLIQYRNFQDPKSIDFSDYSQLSKSEAKFNISNPQSFNSGYNAFSGWVLVPGVPIYRYNTRLVLYRDGRKKGLVFPTSLVERKDANSGDKNKVDQAASGFEAVIPQKYASDSNYRVGLLFEVNNKTRLLLTGQHYTMNNGGTVK